MASKFYAVRKGHTPGIYFSWAECLKEVKNVSGAQYKSFATIEEAKAYLNHETINVTQIKTEAIAYVDGSYDHKTKCFSYGVVMLVDGHEKHYYKAFDDETLSPMRNVAGEILGAQKAMQYCIEHQITSLALYYDYEGIENWCSGAWEAKKEGTQAYKAYYDQIKAQLTVVFVKVKGHSNDRYNDLADYLAKKALNLVE